MKDTLQKMLEAETKAEQIVTDAEKQARKTLDGALLRASDVVNEARETSQKDARKIVDEAVEAARKEKAEHLNEIANEVESLAERVPDEHKQTAAELILKAVLME